MWIPVKLTCFECRLLELAQTSRGRGLPSAACKLFSQIDHSTGRVLVQTQGHTDCFFLVDLLLLYEWGITCAVYVKRVCDSRYIACDCLRSVSCGHVLSPCAWHVATANRSAITPCLNGCVSCVTVFFLDVGALTSSKCCLSSKPSAVSYNALPWLVSLCFSQRHRCTLKQTRALGSSTLGYTLWRTYRMERYEHNLKPWQVN